jgi:hypothetical protein
MRKMMNWSSILCHLNVSGLFMRGIDRTNLKGHIMSYIYRTEMFKSS